MVLQDNIFSEYEGDNWFKRNSTTLNENNSNDCVIKMIKFLKLMPRSILEVGCSNGWRLAKLMNIIVPPPQDIYGIDVSKEAIEDGIRRWKQQINLEVKGLYELSVNRKFDLVICNFVLHWIDRRTLIRCIANIDEAIKEGGILIIGDFLPDYQQKRRYHHLLDIEMYTYKQDYGKIFTTSGIYNEVARFTFDHDDLSHKIGYSPSGKRAMCVALKKIENGDFYPEV